VSKTIKATQEPKKDPAKTALRLAVAKLKTREPSEWNRLVARIRSRPVQVKVASIVWFDIFSNRPATDRWDDLDEYLKDAFNPDFQEPATEDVEYALEAVGYPKKMAERRAQVA